MVAQAAGKTLTPCVLELGGKCPTIIDKSANVDNAAKQIASIKFSNAGQLCVNCDYCLIHEDVYDKFIQRLIYWSKQMYTDNAKTSPYYSRMIHKAHCERTYNLLKGHESKIIWKSGEYDLNSKFIPPTIVENPDPESDLMQEEIFGPILPVLKFSQNSEVLKFIENRGRPLDLFYFGKLNTDLRYLVEEQTRSGSIVYNDVGMNFPQHHLPFGGIGDSGYGITKGIHNITY